MIVNKRFKVKDCMTVYTLRTLNDGSFEILWTDDNGDEWVEHQTKEYVLSRFNNHGEWYYLDQATPVDTDAAEHTGGPVNYYKVHVAHPTTLPEAYDAEANDIIESLGLTFAEGNLFKAIWRMAADRNGKKKKGNNSVYDAEKLCFFAERVLVQEKAKV